MPQHIEKNLPRVVRESEEFVKRKTGLYERKVERPSEEEEVLNEDGSEENENALFVMEQNYQEYVAPSKA